MISRMRFRAWDIKRKKMWYPSLVGTDGELYSNPFQHKGFDSYYKDTCIGNKKSQELMQSTGFLDICKREVFAGDIVMDEYGHTYEVAWSDEKGGWIFDGEGELNRCLISEGIFKTKVLGNGFENPELV